MYRYALTPIYMGQSGQVRSDWSEPINFNINIFLYFWLNNESIYTQSEHLLKACRCIKDDKSCLTR